MRVLVLVLIVGSLAACTKKSSEPASTPSEPLTPAQLSERGKVVYQTTCIACHNADPAKDGGVGPAVAGSSRELLEARVIGNSYPPGYTPKRPTKVMPSFPHLAKDLDALTAYLAPAK